MKRLAITLAALALTIAACEENVATTADEPTKTNVTETEMYEDPNVINSEPPEADDDADDQKEEQEKQEEQEDEKE